MIWTWITWPEPGWSDTTVLAPGMPREAGWKDWWTVTSIGGETCCLTYVTKWWFIEWVELGLDRRGPGQVKDQLDKKWPCQKGLLAWRERVGWRERMGSRKASAAWWYGPKKRDHVVQYYGHLLYKQCWRPKLEGLAFETIDQDRAM